MPKCEIYDHDFEIVREYTITDFLIKYFPDNSERVILSNGDEIFYKGKKLRIKNVPFQRICLKNGCGYREDEISPLKQIVTDFIETVDEKEILKTIRQEKARELWEK